MTHADVAVVGAGPAGTGIAMRLAREGMDVVIIERHATPALTVGETFPPSIRLPLESLGVWEEFAEAGHLPSARVRSVWGTEAAFDRDFILSPYGNGWHVDRQRFNAMMVRAAIGAGAAVLAGVRVINVELVGQWWRLSARGDGELHRIWARVVVDASGRAAVVGRRLGARSMTIDHLIGLARYLSRSRGKGKSLELTTLVEAAETGWWYSAPLPGDRLVVAFMTDADLLLKSAGSHNRQWEEWIEGAPLTHARAREYESATAVSAVSACSAILAPSGGCGWVAVGDAALARDPLTGDGVRRALTEAEEVAGKIKNSFTDGADALKAEAARGFVNFREYLRERHAYYRMEQRWSTHPFWRRRH